MTVTGEQVRALRLRRHHLDRPLPSGALVEAGADVLVSGSAFFGHPPFSERLAAFMAAAC